MKDKMERPENSELVVGQRDSLNQEPAGVDSSRRRLFGAGIAVPVVLSMSSRTAWGGGLCGPSAFNSMTFSSHAPPAYVADCTNPSGNGPLFWKNNPGSWVTYLPDAPTAIPPVIGSVAPFSTLNMSDVLSGVTSDLTASIEAHGIAALLNASSSSNLFGKANSSDAIMLVEALFPGFMAPGGSATLPGTTTVVSWNSSSYSMKDYFTNYV